MLKRFFKTLNTPVLKNGILSKITRHVLWRIFFRKYYCYIREVCCKDYAQPDQNSIDFYSQNILRVNAVTSMLTDEKSKLVYQGMIKYRQTRARKDWPTSFVDAIPYFIKELKFNDNEVFIDCGAFDGDTIDDFRKHCRKYEHIVAFEPDLANFDKLNKKYGNNPQITLINAGVFDKDCECTFDSDRHTMSKITNGEGGGILVKTIDSLNLSRCSFIKMDVEGVELNALKGAEKTILRNKPKLAICIYHSNDDMINIAEYVHCLVPEYKLYVRQHWWWPQPIETVLYAVMPIEVN